MSALRTVISHEATVKTPKMIPTPDPQFRQPFQMLSRTLSRLNRIQTPFKPYTVRTKPPRNLDMKPFRPLKLMPMPVPAMASLPFKALLRGYLNRILP